MSETALTSKVKINQIRHDNKYVVIAGFLALLLCLPVIALFFIAFSGSFESFAHIASTIMPSATKTTLLLLLGVGIFTAVVGTVTAWLVAFYEFPFRKHLQWMLMLPLAVPTYISAYAFVEFFSYTGEVQTLVRAIGGYTSSRDYWFPDIRSLTGTVLVMGIVLFPYVYLAVRTIFQLQSNTVFDTARVLGSNKMDLFFRITLPLARPAIILGVTLALMETINDIGAVEHMGTHTLTFSIFSVWLNQSDLAGAAQIALFLLLIVIALIMVERASRGNRKFHETKAKASKAGVTRRNLAGVARWIAFTACFLPVIFGFGIPVYLLTDYLLADITNAFSADLFEAFITSVTLGAIAAFFAVCIGIFMTYALRNSGSKMLDTFVRLASSGYAVPGTLIALGIFFPLAAFDNQLDAFMRSTIGISTGLLLTGSGAALVFAYVVRFMAMAEGNLSNGFNKISPNIDMAARNLGRSRSEVLRVIMLPMLRPAIISASLLIFVDVIKELSATIMLRPFGVETLAIHVYNFASRARVEEAAAGCLLIIAAGAIPVVLLLKSTDR